MAVLIAEHIQKSWADRLVLEDATVRVDERDRVAIVGSNGSGKSTLLQILAGTLDSDHGELKLAGTIALLAQRAVLPGETVADAAAAAVSWHATLVSDYEAALERGDDAEAARLQDQLDTRGWSVDHQVTSVLDRVGAPPMDAAIATLSGGERRRVALATTLLQQPDLLLLDEPTNHLDADAVEWLESYLQGYRGAVLLVTHDRYLLEAVADRIIEVDQGHTVSYEGSYADFLIARAERQSLLSSKRQRTLQLIATEAAWASRSPSARSTKQKARLDRLDTLRENVPTIEERDYAFSFTSGIHKGTTLLQVRDLTHGYGDVQLLDGLDFEIRPRERLGVIGPNGSGKSTLVKLLMREMKPDGGTIERYSRATIGLLDQLRTGLDPDDTVIDAAANGQRHVRIGDHDIAVQSFLGRFAFQREAYEQKVGSLSGGERARLLLAKLMLQGHPILLLDEPTNDLDLLTLRVLEQALLDFDGAALIVTHDRAFLDRVCTGVLAFEGDAQITRYASRQQANAGRPRETKAKTPAKKIAPTHAPTPKPQRKSGKKLSFREQKELDGLPARLEELEQAQAALEAQLADPATYKDRPDDVPALNAKLTTVASEIETAFARWESLEARA